MPTTYTNHTGRRYGLLTVLGEAPRETPVGGPRWSCRCDCGGTKTVRASHLGKTKSCGCFYTSRPVEDKQAVTINAQYCNHRHGAIRADSPPLPRETWLAIVRRPCDYCGLTDTRNIAETSLYRDDPRRRPLTQSQREAYAVSMNGIDRVDNTMGYIVSNSVPCCQRCNLMKNDMPRDTFVAHLQSIRVHGSKTH